MSKRVGKYELLTIRMKIEKKNRRKEALLDVCSINIPMFTTFHQDGIILKRSSSTIVIAVS